MTRYRDFAHLLRDKAEQFPASPALLYEKDGRVLELSFFELHKEVLDRSAEWKRSGKTCLGVLCDGSPECVLTIFSSVFSGMQTVLLDESAPEELLREQLIFTDVDVLWGKDETVSRLAPFLTEGLSSDDPVNGRKGRILFFTSGTTSQVKAVALSDRSLMSSAYNGGCMLPLSAGDRLLCTLPLSHVFGFVCSLLWGLSCGVPAALGRGVRHLAEDLLLFRPTAVSLVPFLLGRLMKENTVNEELRLILVGAGECPEELAGAVLQKGIRLCLGYGLTETSSGVALSLSGDLSAMEICPDVTITIAPDQEILIHCPSCMMQGYYKQPEETGAVLQNGILYTGDLGMIDDSGKLYFIGRKKEILALPDGTKIFLPEYEAQIRIVLPERDFAVVELNQAPVLVVHGSQEEKKAIRSALKGVMSRRLPSHQLKDILLTDSPLPRTAAGKIKRWELLKAVSSSFSVPNKPAEPPA